VIDTNGRQERVETYRVKAIVAPNEILLDSGLRVRLLGVVSDEDRIYQDKAASFLKDLTSGNRIFLKYDNLKFDEAKNLLAYVYLENKTFVNAKLIRSGLAKCDRNLDFHFRDRFIKYEEEAMKDKAGAWEKKGSECHA
jgi:site-specific DNA-methyltransferase (adenine-specific)